MHTDSEIMAMIRRGELAPLTAETLRASIARQEKINARFQAAIAHGFVAGNPLPAAARASSNRPMLLRRPH